MTLGFEPQLSVERRYLWWYLITENGFELHKHIANDPEGLASKLDGCEFAMFGPSEVIPYFKKAA